LPAVHRPADERRSIGRGEKLDVLDHDFAQESLDAYEPPCLSLYQPTHRRHPENQQDPIRFRNLVKALEESLLQKYPMRETQPLLDPFLELADDRDFWNHTIDGLAVLAATGMFRVYKLQRPVSELVVAADSFHTKPLIRILQSADRYHVLGLSRQEIKLFAGNRDALDEIEPAQGVPRTITEALGEELTEPHQTVASYGGAGGSQSAMHHGHGGKESEVDIDTERFFRAVDRGILEHHSRPSTLPLILATLPEHRRLFHQVSHNPFLVDKGIDANPDALSGDELRTRAWQVVEPDYLARLAALAEAFGTARSKDLGQDDLVHVARAIVAGRVASLLIDADREIPGRIDAATGDIELDDLAHPAVDDVLDDLAALALKLGAQVVVVPAERMPTETGIAAIYRY
jgi:Bacterial archaeo-eukaryotic release factor family 3